MRRAGCGHGGEKTATLGHALKVFCRTPGHREDEPMLSIVRRVGKPPQPSPVCSPYVLPHTDTASGRGPRGLLLLLGLWSRVSLFSHPSVYPHSYHSDSLFPSVPNTILYLLFQSLCLSSVFTCPPSPSPTHSLLCYLDANRLATDPQEEPAFLDCWLVH